MRSLISLAAAALAGLAAVISSLDHHADFVPFFVGLTFLGAINAWAVDVPRAHPRRWAAVGSALLWTFAAAWFAVLLVFPFQASGPPPVPDDTFLGLPATLYRMLGLFGGAALVLVATYAPERWSRRTDHPAAADSS
jgi:uncharacterized YccA/Bax inhibitor family protein